MYGQVVTAPRKSSTTAPPSATAKSGYDNGMHIVASAPDSHGMPVAPMRRKPSKSTQLSHHYDVPKSAGKIVTNFLYYT